MLRIPFEGRCRCGTIRYRCDAPPFVAYTCHCRDCQHISGSAYATLIQVPAEAFHVLQGEPATWERTADSGNVLTHFTCPECRSPLFIRNERRKRLRSVYVGSLRHPEAVDVNAHIWTSRKLPWVEIPADHRDFPEAGDWRPDYAGDPTRLES